VGRPLLCHARRADRTTPIGRANPANTSSVERNLNWKLETIGAARRTEQDPVCVCVCVCCRAGNPNAFATPDNFADCVPYLNQTLAHYGYPAQINLPTTTDQHAVRHRERGREREREREWSWWAHTGAGNAAAVKPEDDGTAQSDA
jgi:hypothetical protein